MSDGPGANRDDAPAFLDDPVRMEVRRGRLTALTTDEPILKRLIHYLGRDFDHALPAHALTEHRDEFFASVDPKTVDNFAVLFAKLNATLA